ncbi:phospholipase D-like domain-containing protein [Polaromonas sp. P1(28)-13]|nr:phospholipase D-like domain-containing protein [Polaromonas sp. P1(28)-13]
MSAKISGVTRKHACQDVMRWLPNERRGQFLVAEDIDGFHPKAMFWREQNGDCFAVIGSSNLSKAAFSSNHEVNVFSKISDEIFAEAKTWIKQIESRSVVVSEAWLEQYNEAKQPKRKPKDKSGNGASPVFELALPWPKNRTRVEEVLATRRRQMQVFQENSHALATLFRTSAHAQRWSIDKNEGFYRTLNSLWVFGESGSRFQGAGWERQGKASNFRQLSISLVRVLDASDFDRDDIVTEEIDRLVKKKVTTHGALFSEMLCQFFPNDYHVLDKPVKDWLESTGFAPPAKSTEGIRYIDFARKLRSALQRTPNHPAKNLAELDAIIWLSTT